MRLCVIYNHALKNTLAGAIESKFRKDGIAEIIFDDVFVSKE